MQSKQAKTPPINSDTKLLCFDVETNGLHGAGFAVGAVVMDAKGNVLQEFTGRCHIVGVIDAWVEKNVLSAIKDMPISHANEKDLREAFWKWYLEAEAASDYVLVSNGYPVEYRFLLKCQEENLEERYWQHPFPILDLFSLLLLASDQPSTKSKIMGDVMHAQGFKPHHPLDDAKVAALAAFEAFRLAGKI